MSNWIKCSDRLPENYYQEVIVARDDSAGRPASVAATWDGENFVCWNLGVRNIFVKPTHWQPLPPAPTGRVRGWSIY